MIAWAVVVLLLALVYVVAWLLAGLWGVTLVWLACGFLAGIGLLRRAPSAGRRTRRIVYRRWTAWEYQDWLRRHTSWRRRP